MYNKEHAEHLMEQFADRISGGACAYKDSKKHELLFAKNNVVQLFECADYEDFLREQADDSFDAVYFDPMFRHPFTESAGIHPLRFRIRFLHHRRDFRVPLHTLLLSAESLPQILPLTEGQIHRLRYRRGIGTL